MPGVRTQLLWAGVGVVCYLLAGVVFLWVAFRAGVFEKGATLGSLTTVDGVVLLASVVLFVFGGYAMRRVRRADVTRPEESALPPQYRSGPSDPSGSDTTHPSRMSPEDIFDGTHDSATMRCPNCGAKNDPEYTFCQECSKPLSE